MVSPDTGTTNNTFDAAGNLKTAKDARAVTATYSYDALNRVTAIAYTGTGFSAQSLGFQYDQGPNGSGRLTGFTDPSGSTSLAYSAPGRVLTKTQTTSAPSGVTPSSVTLTLAYGYSPQGQLASLTYPSGKTLGFTYQAGRLASLVWDGAVVLDTLAYHPFGPARSWRWGNATAHARSFDADGRLSTYPAGLANRTLAYDAASRITALTDSANSALNQGYEYDSLDRLTRYLGQPANQSVAYDANGNRSTLTIGASSYVYTYATGKNRLTKTAGPAPVRNFTYDAAGNVKGDGTASFTYDARGRMSQVTRSGSTTQYAHNARGERVRKNGPLVPTGTNYFFYDEAGHLLGEYDQNGNALSEFVWLEDIPLDVIKANEIHHAYTDQLDTPRVILDRLNRVRWRWDAEPFGTTIPNENPSGLGTFSFNLRFPGQYFDKETGLYQNYFRDYDPATGRYIQSDPIGLAGGINPYAHVGGNPVSYSDPTGQLAWVPAAAVVGAVIGGITGGIQAKNSNQSVVAGVLSGVFAGGLAGFNPWGGLGGAIVNGAIGGFLGNLASQYAGGQQVTALSYEQASVQACIGAASGGVGNVVGLKSALGYLYNNKPASPLANPWIVQNALNSGAVSSALGAGATQTIVNLPVSTDLGGFNPQ